MTDEPTPEPSPRIRLAAALVAAEALALLVLAVVEMISLDTERASVAVSTSVFYLLAAVGLALAARGLMHVRAWSRSPIMMTQLIALGVAWSFRDGATLWVTLVLVACAGVVLALVLHPTTTLALYGERGHFDNEPPRTDPGP